MTQSLSSSSSSSISKSLSSDFMLSHVCNRQASVHGIPCTKHWQLGSLQTLKQVQDMSSKTASGAGEPVIQLITRFCSSSIFLVGRTPPRPTAVEEVEVPVEAVAGVEAEVPKRTPTPLTTPQNHQAPNLMQNDQLCPVGGRLGSFAHLWPLVTSYQFVLQTVTKGYRIEFTGNPPRTTEVRCTPIPWNQARHQDLERGLESMLEKRTKQTRLPRKRRKVSGNTHTVPSLPGIDPRPHQHAHFSEREEGRQRVASSVLAPSAEPSAGKDLVEHLSSLRELVLMAVTHTRHIQLMLHSQWTQVSDSPYLRIYPDHESLRELEWWASRANLTVGRPFLRPDPTMTIVTDASMEGWGGHLSDWVISGQWSSAWAKHHINWLELQAVWLTLQHFLPQVRDTAVDVLTDNSTTVAYINKEVGTQSPTLCYLALDLWAWCRQHGIYLVANHISGVRNVLADALSRGKHNHPTEWSLHKTVVQLIFEHWPTPHVDFLASEKNHKLPVFFSVRPSQTSSVINALTQNWESLYGYAYPPTNLIPRVLTKLRLQWSARILLVAPFWPSQPWFRQLTSMLTDLPRMITPKDNLLKNSVTGKFYPKPDRMRLAVWPLSANPSLTEGFHRELQRRQPGPGESRHAGFMIPLFSNTDDGAWSEVWVPLRPL